MHTNRLNLFIVGGLVGVTTICGVVLASTNYKTYATNSGSGSANASVTVREACTLNGVTNPPHITTIANGTSSSDDGFGLTTIKATCNHPGGLSIYAVGWTNDTYGTTTMVGSANSSNVINTGTSGSNSWWAVKVTASGSSYVPTIQNSFNNWHAIPNAWAEVARYTSTTDIGDNAVGSTINVTYKASISNTQAADTYIGKVKYVITQPYGTVPPAPQSTQAGKICYYPNGTSVVGTMGCQSIPTSGGSADTVTPTSATLLASNFSRSGYGFAGWSDAYDYATNPNANFYGPQEYIEFTQGQYSGSNSGLSLYAVWVKSEGNLQDGDTATSVCNRLTKSGSNVTKTLDSVSALTDQRDNQTYAIAKLADDNCWIIENLRLDNTALDNTTGALAQGYVGQFAGLASPEELALFADVTTANTLYSSDGSGGTINLGSTRFSYRIPRYNKINTPSSVSDRPQNPTQNSTTNSTSGAGMYSYGNYYSWAAAVADTTNNGTGDYNTTSICPTGWSIPRGGNKSREETNDFWGFIVNDLNGGTKPANYDSNSTPNYTGSTEGTPVSNALRTYPNNFVYSGHVGGGTVYNRGSVGNYWSSTASNADFAYFLYFGNTVFYPGTFSNVKYNGRSVRCIKVVRNV